MFSMTYTTRMQHVMLLPHSELLFLKSARNAWTTIPNGCVNQISLYVVHLINIPNGVVYNYIFRVIMKY